MHEALHYRQQAERFARVADRCSIPDLVPYYRKMATDYFARARRAEAGLDEPAETSPEPGFEAAMRRAAVGRPASR